MLSSHQEKRELRLWNVETGELLQKLRWAAHEGWEQHPKRGMFSPDGSCAVWGGGDSSIRVYRLTEPDQQPDRATTSPSAFEQGPSSRQEPIDNPQPKLVRSPRWEWILDSSLKGFKEWVETLKSRSFRPVFVNGHVPSGLPNSEGGRKAAPGVRIAAIAVKERHGLPFEILDEAEGDHHPRFQEVRGRGFQLVSQTTFSDGATPRVLSLYTKRDRDTGMWYIPAQWLPKPIISERMGDHYRPFSIATRPEGNSWRATMGGIENRGIAWKFRRDLDHEALRLALNEAKSQGFRPESLFVCPGRKGARFGVVLTRDNPDLLWEIRAALTSSMLESEASRMSNRGYIPDQIVGYDAGSESRYLACWERDPRHYPATGLPVRSLEQVDEALEQFLVEHRFPSATLAILRQGTLAASRGYGYAEESREPIPPNAQVQIGDLSVSVLAAAVRSLIRDKKLREDASLAELLRPPSGSGGEPRDPSSEAPGQPALTVGRLLDGLVPAATQFTDSECKTLAAMIDKSPPLLAGRLQMTDLELRGAVLEQILASSSGKTPVEVAASELFKPAKKSAGATAKVEPGAKGARFQLQASAAEVGAFFVRHELNGRPIKPGAQPKRETFVGQRDKALSLVLRRGELLIVVIARLMEDPPQGLGEDLRACLDRALDSLTPIDSPTKSRLPASR
jgi:hypothetical protein